MADQDKTRARVQQLFDQYGIRDGHDVDKPYVVSVLRDNVPPGWFGLVKELIEDLIRLGWNRRVVQIKEKYGSLRIYIAQREDALLERIEAATEQSYKTCEDCGGPGTWLDEGWMSTLCEHCRAQFRAARGKA